MSSEEYCHYYLETYNYDDEEEEEFVISDYDTFINIMFM